MRPSDGAGLCDLISSLSEESRWLRFCRNQDRAAIAAEAHREANLDQSFGLVGVVHDPQFGPVVACGAGGIQVELLKDVTVRLSPL